MDDTRGGFKAVVRAQRRLAEQEAAGARPQADADLLRDLVDENERLGRTMHDNAALVADLTRERDDALEVARRRGMALDRVIEERDHAQEALGLATTDLGDMEKQRDVFERAAAQLQDRADKLESCFCEACELLEIEAPDRAEPWREYIQRKVEIAPLGSPEVHSPGPPEPPRPMVTGTNQQRGPTWSGYGG